MLTLPHTLHLPRLPKWFRYIPVPKPNPLRVDGIPEAPLTPEPDDAEMAAQALLEIMAASRKNDIMSSRNNDKKEGGEEIRDVRYFNDLAARIRLAREEARRKTMRFLAYCEQQLSDPHLPVTGPGSLQLIETELYKRLDTIEREGGDLKRRWQHCLADVTVRMMSKN